MEGIAPADARSASRVAWWLLDAGLTFVAAAFAVRAVGVGAGPPALAVAGALAAALTLGAGLSRPRAARTGGAA